MQQDIPENDPLKRFILKFVDIHVGKNINNYRITKKQGWKNTRRQ